MVKHHNLAEWHGKDLVDRDGKKIGKLEDVYVDVETDEPMFGTVKEGLFARHLTFVPLRGLTIGSRQPRVGSLEGEVEDAPNIDMHGDALSQTGESALYHHYRAQLHPARDGKRSPARPPLSRQRQPHGTIQDGGREMDRGRSAFPHSRDGDQATRPLKTNFITPKFSRSGSAS